MSAAQKLRIEYVDIDSVQPLERNPRRGDVEFIRGQLKRFGQYVPIVVRRQTSEILKGNHTWHALKEEGAAKAAIVWRDEPDDDEAMKLAIGDNHASDLSEWDVPELHGLLVDLPDLQGTGFDAPALEALSREAALLGAPDPGQPEDPPAPEPPKRAVTKRGDLIVLGEHRLLCGDSLAEKDVARLLDGIEPILINTDPPYGVELDMEWRDRAGFNSERVNGKAVAGSKPKNAAEPSYMRDDARQEGHQNTGISGDTIADWSPAFALNPHALIAYVWHADRFTATVIGGLQAIGYDPVQMLIWDKEQFVLSRSLYHWQHEPCWIARKHKAKVPWHGSRDQSTIIRAPSPKRIGQNDAAAVEGKWDHPTQKPLAVCMPPIANHLLPGEWVHEPFAGSGSTLIAAEHLGRRCAAMEIDPRYCDVIVQRWEELTGEKATRPARRRASRTKKETTK